MRTGPTVVYEGWMSGAVPLSQGVDEHGDLGCVPQQPVGAVGERSRRGGAAGGGRCGGDGPCRAGLVDEIGRQCEVAGFLLGKDGGDHTVDEIGRVASAQTRRSAGDLAGGAQEVPMVAVQQAVVDG